MAVLGIGGLFFRARNPDALAQWYKDTLGVGSGCAAPGAGDPDHMCWMAAGGPVVFAPFAADTDYFPTDKAFMLNLRVSDLEGLIASLGAAGVSVETRADWDHPDVGRFARIHDPEGNPIELWQPPG